MTALMASYLRKNRRTCRQQKTNDNVALSVVLKRTQNPVWRGDFRADFLRLPSRRRCCGSSPGFAVAGGHLTANRAPVSDYGPLDNTIPGLAQDSRAARPARDRCLPQNWRFRPHKAAQRFFARHDPQRIASPETRSVAFCVARKICPPRAAMAVSPAAAILRPFDRRSRGSREPTD